MELKYTIESLKSIVSRVLKRNEASRNDDRILIFEVLKEMGFKLYVPYDSMDAMPSFESITRIRRILQNNEQKFTPDDFTYEKRKKNCNESKEYYVNAQVNSQLSF